MFCVLLDGVVIFGPQMCLCLYAKYHLTYFQSRPKVNLIDDFHYLYFMQIDLKLKIDCSSDAANG